MREFYNALDVITTLMVLSRFYNHYTILIDEILHVMKYEPESFSIFVQLIDELKFKDPSDVIQYFDN